METYNKVFIAAAPMNANINGPAMEVLNKYLFCVVAKVTGTPTGVIHLEASNDPYSPEPNYAPGNFNTIDNSTFTLSASGLTTWNYVGAGFTYVRVSYVDTSGGTSTATMDVRMNAKG